MVAMAAPSCTPRLERLNLGKHALALILGYRFNFLYGENLYDRPLSLPLLRRRSFLSHILNYFFIRHICRMLHSRRF